MAEPFLTWAGGKRKLLPKLRRHIPTQVPGTYYEPFVGGGALFFDLCPRKAVLSDSNTHLIRTYRAVRDDVDQVIAHLHNMRGYGAQELDAIGETYYRVRAQMSDSMPDSDLAACMIYLNRTCFNGLYRVNRDGQFNVPWGRREFSFDPMRLRECSHALKRTWLYAQDFEHTIEGAQEGDLVYADPPYVGTFNAYAARGFDEAEQLRLRDALLRAKERGVYIIASNSVAARPLYADGFNVHYVYAPRRIAANGDRRQAKEIIIT